MWEFTAPGNEETVKIEEIRPIKNCWDPRTWKKQVGVGGIQSWKISGINPGYASIAFDYKRPWESKSVKTKTFDFIVE